MLLNMSLENWLSFKNRQEISMIATREQQHGERVTRIKNLQTRVLPIAMMFGGNASGKTNFFRALDFAKFLVTRGYLLAPDANIPVQPFLLDESSRTSPTTLSFSLLANGNTYDYSFRLDATRVYRETLKRTSSPSEDVGFERVFNEATSGYVMTFGKAHAEDTTLLDLISRTTRPNQLFLASTVMQNVEAFRPVYDWFDKTLCLISPDSEYMAKEAYSDEHLPEFTQMNELLSRFDTGIRHIRRKPVDVAALPIPAKLMADIARQIREGQTVRVNATGRPYLVTKTEGRISAEKLVFCHAAHDGREEEFELDNESDGTKRILDLLPAFVDMESHDRLRVYIIDEIDRCLHTYASQLLVKSFLSTCGNAVNSQLLATTHDNQLMNQNLLRRDEMWLVERDPNEESRIGSVSDFADARKDKDLQHSYLDGRMGGVPAINLF